MSRFRFLAIEAEGAAGIAAALKRLADVARVTVADAYEAGRQAGIHGANEVTAHYSFFTRPELTAAWERGNADGKRERAAGARL